ncbi:DUF6252 family protein [uncultured Pedobacter sp.]|uniref:DUF6252 family protein n=1 Tax=uncultured Pedobacter sp. TaxID=246139 RepID=UPI0025FAF18A|nr:DUF6252 family protein [uncultured Pedobacter sp.]
MKTFLHLTSRFCVLLLFALIFSSCKKKFDFTKKDELPAETQRGADTFGCLIDGKIYTPDGVFGFPALISSLQYRILDLRSTRKSTNEAIGLPLRNMTAVGEYAITSEMGYSSPDLDYKAVDGKITITKYDVANNIVSGRFYFTAKNEKAGKTVSITDGRFDVHFTN